MARSFCLIRKTLVACDVVATFHMQASRVHVSHWAVLTCDKGYVREVCLPRSAFSSRACQYLECDVFEDYSYTPLL